MALLSLLSLLLLPAFAQDPPAPPPTPVEVQPPQSLDEVWASLPAQTLLDEAITRREQGDWAGAEARLDALEKRGVGGATAAYQRALVDELRERYPDALARYQRIQQDFPQAPEATDARFRAALVSNDMGQHAEALALVQTLRKAQDWEGKDALTLQLERGIAEVGLGKTRKGVRHIQGALDALEGMDAAHWMQARARAALMGVMLAEADAMALDNPRKQKKTLAARRALITRADQQRSAIVALGEPEYALDALNRIGDSALRLYQDVNAAPSPPEVASDPETERLYRAMVAQESERFRAVAFQYYDAGVMLAERLSWQGHINADLHQKRDSLQAEMTPSTPAVPTPPAVPEPPATPPPQPAGG